MKRNNIIAILLSFCLFIISFDASAQVKCANKLLADLTGQLPDIGLDDGFQGEVMVPEISKAKPLIVQRDNQGVITHVGIKFFDRDVINRHPSPLYAFVERYFLELLLADEEEISMRLRMERVNISSEIVSLPSTKKGLRDIVSAVSHDFSVYITCNNNRYSVSCLNENKLLAKISFPVRYELITGFTKLEAEASVYPSLLTSGKSDYRPVTDEYLLAYKDSMYCLNDDYYVTEDIISTTYYHKSEGEYVPVFSSDYLKESVYNLFNTGFDWGVQAEIEQNMYGNKKNSFTFPLSQLVNYLKNNNCSIYTGVRRFDKSKIDGVLMAVNMELGYQHILMFSFHKDLFEKQPDERKVKIKMISYVPIHNISSLF